MFFIKTLNNLKNLIKIKTMKKVIMVVHRNGSVYVAPAWRQIVM